MKTIVNAKEIKEAIKLLKSEKVIINAKNNKTKLIMNEITKDNEEVTLIKELTGKVESEGTTIIDNNIMKLIKNNEVIIENNQISFGKRKVKFVNNENNECDFKELNNEGEKILELTKEEYAHIISGMYAVSKEEYRPVLNKVSFENNNGKLRVVCLDGYRVSIRKLNKDFNYKLLVNTYVLKVLNKIKFNTVEILFNEEKKEIIFKTDNGYKLITKIFEGNRILIEQLLPSLEEEKKLKYKIKLDTKELLEIIESYTKDVKVVEMTFNNNKLVLESNESNYKLIDTCEIDYNLEEFIVRYNPSYLKDMLKCFTKNKENKKIQYSINNNISIGIFRLDENTVDYILPIRLRKIK